MAMDFPASPTVGAIYSPAGGPSYRWDGSLWVPQVGAAAQIKQLRNRLINPSMQVSQENADLSSAVVAATSYAAADMWATSWTLTGGTASGRRTRPASTGSDCLQLTVGTGIASPAAPDYLHIVAGIEVDNVRDFQWGTANAKRVLLRFMFYSALGGTYTASIRNAATTRTFLAKFTAAASTWQEFVIPVPGDTSGTWSTVTNDTWGFVAIAMAAGSNWLGAEGWQSGHKLVAPGNSNGAAAGNVFYATDFGLYLDQGLSGVPPQFEPPDVAEETLRCQRYYQVHRNVLIPTGYASAGAPVYYSLVIPMMRATPTVLFAGAAYSNGSGVSLNVATPSVVRPMFIATAAGAAWCDVTLLLNARI